MCFIVFLSSLRWHKRAHRLAYHQAHQTKCHQSRLRQTFPPTTVDSPICECRGQTGTDINCKQDVCTLSVIIYAYKQEV